MEDYMEQLILCLEQKIILLTKILNITKQIEVRSAQPEIELEDFLEQRGVFIERLNKCNTLINSIISELPSAQKSRTKMLLNLQASESDCNSDEQKILKLSKKCSELIKRITDLDTVAHQRIKKERDELMEKINELRKKEYKETPYQTIN
jgi:hypothetical protein